MFSTRCCVLSCSLDIIHWVRVDCSTISIQILAYQYKSLYIMTVTLKLKLKPLKFLGSSHDDLRHFPSAVRHELGVELMRIQFGAIPVNFKPMASVGAGA